MPDTPQTHDAVAASLQRAPIIGVVRTQSMTEAAGQAHFLIPNFILHISREIIIEIQSITAQGIVVIDLTSAIPCIFITTAIGILPDPEHGY